MDAKRPAAVPAAAVSASKKQKIQTETPKGVDKERPFLENDRGERRSIAYEACFKSLQQGRSDGRCFDSLTAKDNKCAGCHKSRHACLPLDSTQWPLVRVLYYELENENWTYFQQLKDAVKLVGEMAADPVKRGLLAGEQSPQFASPAAPNIAFESTTTAGPPSQTLNPALLGIGTPGSFGAVVKVLGDTFIDDLAAKIEAHGQSLLAAAKGADDWDPDEDGDSSEEVEEEEDLAEMESAGEEEEEREGPSIDIASPEVEEEWEDEEAVDRLLRSQREEVERDLAFVNDEEEEVGGGAEEEEDEVAALVLWQLGR